MIQLHLTKKLGTFDLNLKLTAETGGFYSLSGKSGAGKTSLLRMIAGLMIPDSGFLKVGDETWFDSGRKFILPPQKRNIGYVFQDYALFPHMTVRQNICYGTADRRNAEYLIDLCGLNGFENRYPGSLSGGQKQRVALARALAPSPKLLLLDEPLSALDSKLRSEIQDTIARIYRETNVTVFLVSHDLPEIFKLSSYVFELSDGKIVREGIPRELFLNQSISSKFAFTGEIIRIIPADLLYIAVISFGNQISEIVLTKQDIQDLKKGDQVMVASKAFNPIVKKIR